METRPTQAQPPSNQPPSATPPRLALKADHGVPVSGPLARQNQSGGFWSVFLFSLLALCVGAAAGWFSHRTIENGKQYERYAAELKPLLYYKDRVHRAKSRGSNETMRIVNHKIYQAHCDGLDIKKLLDLAQPKRLQPPALTKLNETRFLSNLQLGIAYGLYEGDENQKALAYGKAPKITKGEHIGEVIHVEHVVPKAIAPTLDNVLANLMWFPASLNQSKSDTITDDALQMAEVFADEGILPVEELVAVKGAFRK